MPTRYDKILANMTIGQMAEIRTFESDQYDMMGDYDGTLYANSTGSYRSKEEAIQAEIEWLQGVEE